MSIKLHERDLRGATNMGWLDSKHTFSFGHFYDPERMGFRALRVINDDYIIGGAGFGEHGHDNMEIISIALDGALEHKDSMGNGSIIRPGEIQKMSAGSGVRHSEFNASAEDTAHFLQIWIVPDTRDIEPSYEQVRIDREAASKGFTLIGGAEKGGHQVSIHQDVTLHWAEPVDGQALSYEFQDGRYGFLHIAQGQVEIDSEMLKAGDALELSGVSILKLKAAADSQLLLFDLA
jgi:hypothetical protein